MQAFDSSSFRSKSHFDEDGTQNYLVFQSMYRYFKRTGNTERISWWNSKGFSDEIIKPSTSSDNSLAPVLSNIGNKTRVKFDGGSLKQDKVTFTHVTIVNIYIVYEISFSDSNNSYTALKKVLFGAVKLIKNTDNDNN